MMTFLLSSQVQICENNLNADDTELLEELDRAYIWMVDDG